MLVASAASTLAASWLRWADACPPGSWGSAACLRVQDHAYDAVPVGDPWRAEPAWSLLGGLGLVLLAVALTLLPSALPARRWQRGVLRVAAVGVLVVGASAVASGVLDRAVEVPVHAVAVYLWVLAQPVALLLYLPGPGPRRGLVLVALLLATPLPQLVVRAVAAPWSDAAVGPCLLVAALALVRRA